VKICSLYGDGFYYIPGTDTCLKLGGYLRVQAEYNMGNGGVAAGTNAIEDGQARFTRDATNDVNYRVRVETSWDVRQQTEYGPLRTYLRFGVGLAIASIRGKVTDLRAAGFTDPIKMITSSPAILGLAIDNIHGKIADLSELGFADPVKMITSKPSILGYATEIIAARSPTCANSALLIRLR
jgi:hypothetical protein